MGQALIRVSHKEKGSIILINLTHFFIRFYSKLYKYDSRMQRVILCLCNNMITQENIVVLSMMEISI